MATQVEFLKKVATYVSATQRHMQKQAEAHRKVADAAPAVAEMLVSKGLIEPYQKQACVASLQDPAKALEILKIAASRISLAPASLGAAEKTASAEKPAMRDSDRAFVEKLFG